MKTVDGIKLENILRAATTIDGVKVREGHSHRYLLEYNGYHPCPVAASTNVRTMVVPWLKRVTNYNSNELYASLKRGYAIGA